ncbi:MAG: zf-TFIIB domain-containing protein [Capsulimonas sp.]|uniref:TFIIB-type zinc ribbon-containing protein n=1 Tax=Capsulimonas sp. TaxID=2494211 RepID=UPI0032670CF3
MGTTTETRRCPVGCGPLTPLKFRGVTLDRCQVCAGVWFDASEYEALEQLPEAALRTLEVEVEVRRGPDAPAPHAVAAPVRSCPACKARLQPVHLTRGVKAVLDHCGNCYGYWADDSELAMLSEVLDGEKPYFAPELADQTRKEVSVALSEALTPRQEIRITVFQTICVWLTRPIVFPVQVPGEHV